KLFIRAEVDSDYYESDEYDEEKLKEEASENLKAVLNINAKLRLLEPGTLPRTVGKAKRVIDQREEQDRIEEF
ncbi:MAG: phenylacetate--CoA ligase, partial [Candidatus Thermoplasmatota archaeon]|nr:phenylacetate--CoA ligase [Candidatus Thermoplasmatota archaeon]